MLLLLCVVQCNYDDEREKCNRNYAQKRKQKQHSKIINVWRCSFWSDWGDDVNSNNWICCDVAYSYCDSRVGRGKQPGSMIVSGSRADARVFGISTGSGFLS